MNMKKERQISVFVCMNNEAMLYKKFLYVYIFNSALQVM